jgi:hypothetical protein
MRLAIVRLCKKAIDHKAVSMLKASLATGFLHPGSLF